MVNNQLLTKFNSDTVKELKSLFDRTFTNSEGKSEGELIGNLVEELIKKTPKEDIFVFASLKDSKIIASEIFTRLKFEKSDTKAFILGPVAVGPEHEKQGIGSSLIKFGLDKLKDEQINLAFTYGDINFYSKVGFKQISEEIIKAPLKLSYPEGWLVQSLTGEEIKSIEGKSFCVDAFNDKKYW